METSYTVNESVSMLQVNVSVISPPPGVELLATIDLGIQSFAKIASKLLLNVDHSGGSLHFAAQEHRCIYRPTCICSTKLLQYKLNVAAFTTNTTMNFSYLATQPPTLIAT